MSFTLLIWLEFLPVDRLLQMLFIMHHKSTSSAHLYHFKNVMQSFGFSLFFFHQIKSICESKTLNQGAMSCVNEDTNLMKIMQSSCLSYRSFTNRKDTYSKAKHKTLGSCFFLIQRTESHPLLNKVKHFEISWSDSAATKTNTSKLEKHGTFLQIKNMKAKM